MRVRVALLDWAAKEEGKFVAVLLQVVGSNIKKRSRLRMVPFLLLGFIGWLEGCFILTEDGFHDFKHTFPLGGFSKLEGKNNEPSRMEQGCKTSHSLCSCLGRPVHVANDAMEHLSVGRLCGAGNL